MKRGCIGGEGGVVHITYRYQSTSFELNSLSPRVLLIRLAYKLCQVYSIQSIQWMQ